MGRKRYIEPSSSSDSDSDEGAMHGSQRSSRPRSDHGLSKLELRKIRNRESAAASRKRKSDRILELEAQVAELSKENASLKEKLACPGRSCQHMCSPSLSRRSLSPSSSSTSPGGVPNVVSCTNQLPAVYALLRWRSHSFPPRNECSSLCHHSLQRRFLHKTPLWTPSGKE